MASPAAVPERWVVVGAGSAGCVVAGRLSEDDGRSVVLLEAGPDLRPGEVPDAISGPSFHEALALPDRVYPHLMARRSAGGAPSIYRRGRGVGGSSAVNALVALRGDPALYASWGWHDAPTAWDRVAVPAECATADEFGPLDRALLDASSDATPAPLTRRAGRRVTSAEAYLWPALHRSNLEVRSGSLVESVVVDGRRAVAVRLADGTTVDADRVVIASGAIHSPAILQRSRVVTPGIGDGLQDHPSVAFTVELRDPVPAPASTLAAAAILQRGGMQVLPLNHLGGAGPATLGVLLAAVMRPFGRAGSVRAVLDDPLADPEVTFNLLEDPRDVEALSAAARLVLDLLDHEAFRAIVGNVYIDEHGTTAGVLADGDTLRRWIGSAVGDYVHASSSCAMGSVVDPDGAVIGYEQLYVCDASVFPSIPDVNTHLPTTMLAERLVGRWRTSWPMDAVAG